MHTLKYMLSNDEALLEDYSTKINKLNDERKEMQEVIVEVGDKLIQDSGVANSINIVVEGRVGVVGLTLEENTVVGR